MKKIAILLTTVIMVFVLMNICEVKAAKPIITQTTIDGEENDSNDNDKTNSHTNHIYNKYESQGSSGHIAKCECGAKLIKTVAHDYKYSNKYNGKHEKSCKLCSYSVTEEHNYTSYEQRTNIKGHKIKCACGAYKSETCTYTEFVEYTETKHFFKCVCGRSNGGEKHNTSNNGKCSKCGYGCEHKYEADDYKINELIVKCIKCEEEHEHIYEKDTFVEELENHYITCIECGFFNSGPHVFTNGECELCGIEEHKHYFKGVGGRCQYSTCNETLKVVSHSAVTSLPTQSQYVMYPDTSWHKSLGTDIVTLNYPPYANAEGTEYLSVSVAVGGFSHGDYWAHYNKHASYESNKYKAFSTATMGVPYGSWSVTDKNGSWLAGSRKSATVVSVEGNQIVVDYSALTGHNIIYSMIIGGSSYTGCGSRLFVNGGSPTFGGSGLTVTVKHINDTTGTELKSESVQVKRGEKAGPYNRISENDLKAYGNNFQYENRIDKIIGNKTSEEKGDTVSLTNITESVTIIFHYSQYAQVKVVGRINKSPYALLYEEEIEKINLSNGNKTKSYNAKTLGGFKCIGYKIENTLESDLENISNNKSSGKIASVTINVSNSTKLITFLYEINDIAFSITHVDESTGILMEKNPAIEAETAYTGSLGYLLSEYVDLANNPEILEKYTDVMKSSKTDAQKAAEVIRIINQNWSSPQNNLIMLKSLNIYNDFYSGYVNKGFEVEGIEILNTQNQAADGSNTIKQTERYIPSLMSIVAALESGISITDGTVNLVFKYSKGDLHVKHIQVGPEKDDIGNYKEKLLEENKIGADTVNTIEIPSLILSGTYEGMLNWNATLDGTQVMANSNKLTKNQYTVIVPPAGASREIIFYYVKPEVEVSHIYLDESGNELSRTGYTEPLDGTKNIRSNDIFESEYINQKAEIDGIVKKQVGEDINLKEQYSLTVEPINPSNRKVEFYYTLFGAGIFAPVTCDPELDKNVVEVDSEITITIPNYGYHIDLGESDYYNQTYAYKKLIKFPFEVYFEGSLKGANTWIEVANRSKIEAEGTSVGKYKFRIPTWTKEKYKSNDKYTVEVWVTSSDSYTEDYKREQSNDILNGGQIATGKVSLNVIGKLYDFSVANLENDEIWQAGLFAGSKNGHEYKANELPIGQANTVQKVYKYGMKLGSTFLFSVNTLGVRNEKIKIIPKVYFVGKDGGTAVDVTNKITFETATGKVEYNNDTSITLATKLNKVTRMNAKVQQEVKKSLEMKNALSNLEYGKNTNDNITYGHYNGLIITKSLRLPYYEYLYGNDTEAVVRKNIYVENDNKALTGASHWYGEYKLPATTKYTEELGFFIVCFKISTIDDNGQEYLKYENQQLLGNQWLNENGNKNPVTIKLPDAYNLSGKTTTINIKDGYYPVAIYQSNISVNSNYEVGATH